jgi:hypothetical protein
VVFNPKYIRVLRAASVVAASATVASGALVAATALAATTPPPVTRPVPTPYDDLSSNVCDGSQSSTVVKIATADGFTKDVYALPGDTIQLAGLAKACQTQYTSSDALQWGFVASEVGWTFTSPGGVRTDLGTGTILQSGRTTIPTQSLLSRTLTAADDLGRVNWGVPLPVDAPNGLDTSSATTTVTVHVLDPKLELVKEVCATGTGCDPADDAHWRPETAVVSGSAVDWRLTARNTGNIALADVTVADDTITGPGAGATDCAGRTIAAHLPVGATAALVCSTSSVTSGEWVTNTARLGSVFADPSGGALLDRFGGSVDSAPAEARVRALVPSLALTKQVCVTGIGCDIADDTQWTERVVVAPGTDAEWRLTVRNTGDLTIADVVPSLETLSGGKTGASAECGALAFGDLAPGESRSRTCVTTSITDAAQDTVNTAVVTGAPLGPDGGSLEADYPDGVASNQDDAAAAIVAAGPDDGETPSEGPDGPPAPAPDGSGGPGTSPDTAPDGTGGEGKSAEDTLAKTGSTVSDLARWALLLLIVGLSAMVFRRRSRRA